MADLIKLTNQLLKELPQTEFNVFGYSALMGKIVFAYRIRAGLTQNQLADLAGIAPKTVHRIEGGSDNITAKTYSKVFDVLKITTKELGEAFSEDATKKLKWEQESLVHI